MKLENEIRAYSLQNAIEFGKTDSGKILPKLFQHGLEKKDIRKIMPLINDVVKEINSLSVKEREKEFEKFKKYIKEREEKERGLPELEDASKKMVFRIAPFPSGSLHIGNAKTFLLNALYAEKYGGKIVLVMDDTIGSAEKPPLKEGYKLIEEALKMLGVKYGKIVYKSDRLKIFYDYAEKLIKKGKAYVDFSNAEEMREMRAKGVESGDRQFPPDIQMKRWKEMFKMKEGHAVLRLKTSMQDPNPAFRDRVLFKISDREHPRVGKKYRVWPTLEMSWAVDDHDLGITHILRGNDLVMETQMEKFIWDVFGWKHPKVYHTGLVRIDGLDVKISKSKSQKDVLSGKFFGWDDPRTWSIQSLIKRGIRAEALKEFVEEIGLNKQDITIPIESLYSINRKLVDLEADRHSFISDFVELELENNLGVKDMDVKIHPDRDDVRNVKIGKSVFVSKDDFKKFKGKEVRLIGLFNIKMDKKSEITSVDNKKIPKVNWILSDVNARVLMPDGVWVEGLADSAVGNLKVGDIVQFERFGFACYQGKHKDKYEFWFAHS